MELPIIDLSSSDRLSTAISIRQACIEYGFFYLVNHGLESDDIVKAFDESKRFFSLPLQDKMKLARKEFRGYTPKGFKIYAENEDVYCWNIGSYLT